jgi:UDP-glucose 4-epimerase
VEKIWAQSEKANTVLKWKTEKTLADSLRDAWRWQQKLTKK